MKKQRSKGAGVAPYSMVGPGPFHFTKGNNNFCLISKNCLQVVPYNMKLPKTLYQIIHIYMVYHYVALNYD
jgi:hypothetical protein